MIAQKDRFDFLDVLRFIAATSVLIQHTFEATSPSFVHFSTYYFQFGMFGVTLFFLTSGFIIPFSLERVSSVRKFWIGRVFRLYPLYLLSLVVTLACIYFGFFKDPFPSTKTIFLHLTMIQHFLGQKDILGLYWTLGLEMFFYAMVTFVYWIGYIKKSVLLAFLMLFLAFIVGTVLQGVLHIIANGWGTVYYMATMFTGTVYYRYVNQQIRLNTFVLTIAFAALVLFSNCYFVLYKHDQPQYLGDKSFFPVIISTVSAYCLFTLFCIFRQIKFPAMLVFTGSISYSLYLVQGTVIGSLPRLNNPYATVVYWSLSTFVISYFTFTYVEKPFINMGKRISKIAFRIPERHNSATEI